MDLMMTGRNVDSEVSFRISTMYDPDTTVWETTQVAGEDAARQSTTPRPRSTTATASSANTSSWPRAATSMRKGRSR
ncbi:hypothetical protein IOD13_00575 [Brevibacterium casei]|nr:hypothetical protein [Brevibacterium casei]